MTRSHGFPPIARADARVLILGALPGRDSLMRREYYGHSRNAFWRIMGEVTGVDPELPYKTRCERLIAHLIAVWDVCRTAERAGSLDSAIRDPQANAFEDFFNAHPDIHLVVFNGQTPEMLFARLVRPYLSSAHVAVPCQTLPSTSPAFAGMSFQEKLARWRAALAGAIDPGLTAIERSPP